jgi:hypothetical protein
VEKAKEINPIPTLALIMQAICQPMTKAIIEVRVIFLVLRVWLADIA